VDLVVLAEAVQVMELLVLVIHILVAQQQLVKVILEAQELYPELVHLADVLIMLGVAVVVLEQLAQVVMVMIVVVALLVATVEQDLHHLIPEHL
jgi:hypothetical protein